MSEKLGNKSVVREYAEAIVVAILLALCIRTFVVQAFKIPSGSMLPTLQIGDHLLVNKFIYGIKLPFTEKIILPWKSPIRGDVVVFKFPKDKDIDYIKRVIGVAGDKVEIVNKKLKINDAEVVDLHAHFSTAADPSSAVRPRDNFGPVTVPTDKIFVMGDNRDNSYDSRFWGFVDQADIQGRAFILYWSWDIDTPLLSVARLMSIRWSRIGDIIQ